MLNLVCQLVRDAFSNAFDVSVIVTNADPIEPIVRMSFDWPLHFEGLSRWRGELFCELLH